MRTVSARSRFASTGEIKLSDWWRVFLREAGQGVVLGLALSVIGMGRVAMWGDGLRFMLTIGCTLVAICVMGCTIGSMFPMLLRRLGLDPATSSAPFIASLVDVSGIIIYFNIAQWLLANVIAQAVQTHGAG